MHRVDLTFDISVKLSAAAEKLKIPLIEFAKNIQMRLVNGYDDENGDWVKPGMVFNSEDDFLMFALRYL